MTDKPATGSLQGYGLTVYRGEEPLFENVSVQVSSGEILQIEGNNGVGKTTLLKALCGLIVADEGHVEWQGQDIRRQSTGFHEHMLFLGHKPGLKPELSAVENLRSQSRLRTRAGTELLDHRIHKALQRLQIGSRMSLPCAVLSAGQKRRVALARLLLEDVALWILDEPLTALDAEGRKLVHDMMLQHLDDGGTIVYTTHQPLSGFTARSRTLRLGRDAES